jgi:hypothetical protein
LKARSETVVGIFNNLANSTGSILSRHGLSRDFPDGSSCLCDHKIEAADTPFATRFFSAPSGPAGTSHRRRARAPTREFSTMGLTFTKLFNKLFSKKEMRILMVRAGSVFRPLSNGGRQKFGIRSRA